jgi:CheY-like chemotaxis protein
MSELQTVSAENLQIALTATSATSASSIALPLVLIAAATPASRTRRTRQLEDRGFRVALARTSFETIVKASCHVPDLILIDASLGEADVHETTKLLSSCPATAHIPIVRVSPGRRLPSRVHAVAR